MNSNHRPTDIEAQLDAAIDALNAGRPVSTNGDPELSSLVTTIQRARATAEPEWPDADFPARMAGNLSAQLRTSPRARRRAGNGQFSVPPTTQDLPTLPTRSGTDAPALVDEDQPTSRRRQLVGIFATAAGFTVLTLVLIAVFQNWPEPDESSGITTSTGEPRQIAFVKDIPGDVLTRQAELFLVDTDGDNLTNLTNNPANDRAPAWSPDGETLAFVSDRTGQDQIYLMDADGGNVRQLTSGDRSSEAPAWSPDGTQIAYIHHADGSSPWIIDADGANQRPLQNASEGDPVAPPFTWSPDGEMIAYAYQRTGLGVGISSTDGERSRLITLPGETIFDVDWSADGDTLAVAPFTEEESVGLIETHDILDDSELEPLPLVTGADMNASRPRWAPSGSRLLFLGSVGEPPESSEPGLYVADIDAPFVEKIHAPDANQGLVRAAWSPDGHAIAFTRLGEPRRGPGGSGDTFELVVINADGTGEHVLAEDIWAAWTDAPAWRPHPSDGTTPPPTQVPHPDQTAAPISDATPVTPSPDGLSTQEPEGTIAALDPPAPTTGDFAAEVQAALDALPGEMAGCAAMPGTALAGVGPGDQGGTEYRGLALIGAEPLNALLFGVEGISIQQSIGPSMTAMILLQLDADSPADMQLDIRELEQGTTAEPSWGPNYPVGDWVGGTAQQATVTFPHSGCWQVIATQGDAAGIVWIDVPEEPLESAQPTLTLDPAIGTCETIPALRGAGFEPGTQITIFAGQGRGDNPVTFGDHATVAVDGTFEFELELQTVLGSVCQTGQIPSAGIEYTISVMTGTGPKPDGDDWRDPSASTIFTLVADESSASQEALDAAILESAIETVRAFLGEPSAGLTGDVVTTPAGERQAFLSRQVDGVPYEDEFIVDVRTDQLVSANIPSRTTLGLPAAPVSQEEAASAAEQIASRARPGFDQLTQTDSADGCTMPGADEPDPCVTFTWQLRANDLVWYPSGVSVTVDLETGQVVRFSNYHEVYRGPLEPQISEAEARAIATDNLNADPDLEGQEITGMRLAITQVVTELNTDGIVTGEEWRLTWTAELSGPSRSGVRLNIVIDASTGEVLNPEWMANG